MKDLEIVRLRRRKDWGIDCTSGGSAGREIEDSDLMGAETEGTGNETTGVVDVCILGQIWGKGGAGNIGEANNGHWTDMEKVGH
jgi:hypothetical protein